ncbi:sensor histidine kinase [Phycicoccus sonneratiae]|uniref:histidine kinase n=1 Tax=Phycicoccus sonneratiae TaxID=2807628 RepID=A0ABS2CLR7_9MICO|nr:ATP-binding protein [Phycicoccus sonneraticus]MBM6400821.1 GAF domain-containing protein [Phycicoccus sonneraticus]
MSTAGLHDAGSALRPGDAQEMLERQTEVLELIAGGAPLTAVLTEILGSLERLIPGACCSVLLLDRERGTLHHGAAPSLPAGYVAAIDGLPIGDGAGSCGTAAALDVVVVARDVRTDRRWVDFRPAADAAGLRACWSTPIDGRDGLPVGTFAVYHPHPHRPTPREEQLVDRYTHLASVAIEHAEALGELVESEERFRRSFDDNSLGMAIIGLDGTVVTANTALVALAGGRGGLVGRSLADVLVPSGSTLGARLAALHADDVAPVVFEAALRRDPAPEVQVEVTVSLLHGRDGEPAQYVVNVFDLTERHAAERHRRARTEAETARRTAERLLRERSALLAAVGHEARTPIQAIVGFAELLGTMDLDPDRRREALARIDAAAGHVMELLADVLDLSRLEAGALPLALEPVAVREVVEEVLGLLSDAAARRGTSLGRSLADDLVLADRRRLRQLLLNLVGNAVRHGRTGGAVEVRTRPGEDPGVVVLSVDDDGPGIPADLLPRVFQPYVHAARAAGPPEGGRTPDEGSIGLGLGLAHGLAVAMDGELAVGATSAAGTSMVLRLPRARVRRPRRRPSP